LKYGLLERDKEVRDERTGQVRVEHDFVNEVVGRAQGLPLYVRFVVEDLLSGELSFGDEGRLPRGLSAYYEDLLTRLAIGDLQAVLTPLVVGVAWAEAPLGIELLHRYLVERTVLTDDPEGRELLRRAVAAASSILKLAPTPEGGVGYVPYHESFREHIRGSAQVRVQGARAKEAFCRWAIDWAQLAAGLVRQYALCHGPAHLILAERWNELATILGDLKFIEAKCAAGFAHELVSDYREALRALPDTDVEKTGEDERQERLRQYTTDLIECAKRGTEARARYRAGPGSHPPQDSRPPDLPHSIILTLSSLPVEPPRPGAGGPLPAEQPTPETRTLSRLDRIRAFGQFAASQAHHLARHATQPWFTAQQACNSADSGPVVEAAIAQLEARPDAPVLLLRPRWRPPFCTRPACLRTLEGHLGPVNAVAMTVDGRFGISGSSDGTVRLWELDSGQCLRILEGHVGSVAAVAVTPDRRLALSGGEDRIVRVWDLAAARCATTLEGHAGAIDAVALTPDGALAVLGSEDLTLRVWDLCSGEGVRVIEGHAPGFAPLALTLDGARVLSAGLGRVLRTWDLRTGRFDLAKGPRLTTWWRCRMGPLPRRRRRTSGSRYTEGARSGERGVRGKRWP
ncbi:MAG: WD40 repeat domain-containing protein, partial [Candidatus Riflebacteria bacterium]|nr:WD40 repeat domain-containing protein [Candidatus Riflebacteria bacterium]